MNIIRQILEYLLVFCIILEFYTTYLVFPIIERTIQIIPIFILLCLIIISKYSLLKKNNIPIFVYLVGSLIPMLIIDKQFYITYILKIVLLLPLFWIYLNLRKEKGEKEYFSLFFKFSNVIAIIASISIIMWLFCSIMHIIPVTAYIPYTWGKEYAGYVIPTYWGIYFETQSVTYLGEKISRNTGFFNEGPMFNMVLCTAFLIEYFIRTSRSKIRLCILTLTILSTLTTTGQFFLSGFACWAAYNKLSKKYRIVIILLVPIILYFFYEISIILLENKIEMGGESSLVSRTKDIELCLKIGFENPILGIGLFTKNNTINGIPWGYSNSLFSLFARGGIYVLSLYISALLFIPYRYYRRYKNSRWLFTMICYFFFFTITISQMKYLTFLFLAWGLSNINLKKWRS